MFASRKNCRKNWISTIYETHEKRINFIVKVNDIILVLCAVIDFRSTLHCIDFCFSLCNIVHVSFILMETAIYLRCAICQSVKRSNLRLLKSRDVERIK